MKNLLRTLALVGAFALTFYPNAFAGLEGEGVCYVTCYNGPTAGPYWSTPSSCCEDFERLCGSQGFAYTEHVSSSGKYYTFCLVPAT